MVLKCMLVVFAAKGGGRRGEMKEDNKEDAFIHILYEMQVSRS